MTPRVSRSPRAKRDLRFGTEVRRDDIDTVGLYRTVARERIGTIREDGVVQTSSSVFVEQDVRLTDYLRATGGVRYDYFDFDVDSNVAANSGKANDSIVSPKLAIVIGPWAKTELFVNVGRGFHSNDARGTTITVDPTDGVTPADRVSPLVTARGGEIGVRTAIVPRTQFSASLWTLELDSELLFVGDGGITESNRASRRRGVEARGVREAARLADGGCGLRLVARAVHRVRPGRRSHSQRGGSRDLGGPTADHPSGWFGGARLRYFGAAPLIEDNSVRSEPTTHRECGCRLPLRERPFGIDHRPEHASTRGTTTSRISTRASCRARPRRSRTGTSIRWSRARSG